MTRPSPIPEPARECGHVTHHGACPACQRRKQALLIAQNAQAAQAARDFRPAA